MVFIFKSSVLVLCALAIAQEDKKIFDLRPKTMLMRSNREEVKPATENGEVAVSKEMPAEPEHKIFDLRKKHSEDAAPSPVADSTANSPSEPQQKKVFDLSKRHSHNQQEEAKQHGPEPNPNAEPEQKKVFDLRKKHGGQEPEAAKQPSVVHVENMYKSESVNKPAGNFVVVEPKQQKTEAKPSTASSEIPPQKAPALTRNAHHQHDTEAAGAKGTGWFSFLLAMVIVISFLLAVANFVQRGAHLHAGKPGKQSDFCKQIAVLVSQGSFKDVSSLFRAVPIMQPAKDPMKEV